MRLGYSGGLHVDLDAQPSQRFPVRIENRQSHAMGKRGSN